MLEILLSTYHLRVVVEPGELDKLRTENEKSISIDAFIRAEALDPTYYGGRTYYLIPDGRVAQKPDAFLQEVMAAHERYGVMDKLNSLSRS